MTYSLPVMKRHDPARLNVFLLSVVALLYTFLGGCTRTSPDSAGPTIEFTNVPIAERGDPEKLEPIQGRVHGASPNQRIVLYAGTESTWWVQPYANQPFTKVLPDSTWTSLTHPGFQYAALLVGPEFRLAPVTDTLPTQGVIARAVTKGKPPVWLRWWFLTGCCFAGLLAALGFHLFRLKEMEDRLNGRFAERLAERTRVAQLLHDTLLQSVISTSMQLHVVVNDLPAGSPSGPALERVLLSMRHVVEEGRNTLKGLRSSTEIQDLEDSFSRIPQEFGLEGDVRVRVNANVPAMPMPPALAADLYTIGRDILVAVFRRAGATKVEVELRCTPSELRLSFNHDGRRIDPCVQPGQGGVSGTPSLRALVEKMGARLKVRNRLLGGNKIVLRVPGRIAFPSHVAWPSSGSSKWLRGWAPSGRGDGSGT